MFVLQIFLAVRELISGAKIYCAVNAVISSQFAKRLSIQIFFVFVGISLQNSAMITIPLS